MLPVQGPHFQRLWSSEYLLPCLLAISVVNRNKGNINQSPILPCQSSKPDQPSVVWLSLPVGKDSDNKIFSLSISEKINSCSPFQFSNISQNSYAYILGPEIPFLDIYPAHMLPPKCKDYMYEYVYCSILTIVKNWKQLKCHSVGNCLNKLGYISREYFAAIRMNVVD